MKLLQKVFVKKNILRLHCPIKKQIKYANDTEQT